jgi:hypothetical protein
MLARTLGLAFSLLARRVLFVRLFLLGVLRSPRSVLGLLLLLLAHVLRLDRSQLGFARRPQASQRSCRRGKAPHIADVLRPF